MRICLLTPGQPSTNPRLVKEADALSESGHEVIVLSAYWASWALEFDRVLLQSRTWSCRYVGGIPQELTPSYFLSRLRHGVARRVLRTTVTNECVMKSALSRVAPELEREAKKISADLYIAHNLGALPAAGEAACSRNALLGFDAEDFHSARGADTEQGRSGEAMMEHFERKYIPQCDYVTASSPLIAEAYETKYGIKRPTSILNVFPLSDRPAQFRAPSLGAPLRLYWFSQTIGANRGLEDILRAMGLLKDVKIELHLRGIWQRGYQRQLFELASRSALEMNQVVSYPPALPEQMVRIASEFDVGLSLDPGNDENRQMTLTNKLFTYLLAGNVVVATRTRAQSSMIDELGSAAFLYNSGDIPTLAQQLRLWACDGVTLEEARRQAWKLGEDRFNWDIEKKRFLGLIERLFSQHVEASSHHSA